MAFCPSTFEETTMRHALMFAAVFAALTLRAPAQDQPSSLFNGKDPSGWTPVLKEEGADPARTWSVADGLLKCTGKPAEARADAEYFLAWVDRLAADVNRRDRIPSRSRAHIEAQIAEARKVYERLARNGSL